MTNSIFNDLMEHTIEVYDMVDRVTIGVLIRRRYHWFMIVGSPNRLDDMVSGVDGSVPFFYKFHGKPRLLTRKNGKYMISYKRTTKKSLITDKHIAEVVAAFRKL